MNTVTLKVSKFSDRVRKARLDLGISVEKLAERVGIARQTVTCYENGSKEPSLETLIRLAAALGKTVGYFFDDPAEGGSVSLEEVRRSYNPVEIRLARIENLLAILVASRKESTKDEQSSQENTEDPTFASDMHGRPYDTPEQDAKVPEYLRKDRIAARMPPGKRKPRDDQQD